MQCPSPSCRASSTVRRADRERDRWRSRSGGRSRCDRYGSKSSKASQNTSASEAAAVKGGTCFATKTPSTLPKTTNLDALCDSQGLPLPRAKWDSMAKLIGRSSFSSPKLGGGTSYEQHFRAFSPGEMLEAVGPSPQQLEHRAERERVLEVIAARVTADPELPASTKVAATVSTQPSAHLSTCKKDPFSGAYGRPPRKSLSVRGLLKASADAEEIVAGRTRVVSSSIGRGCVASRPTCRTQRPQSAPQQRPRSDVRGITDSSSGGRRSSSATSLSGSCCSGAGLNRGRPQSAGVLRSKGSFSESTITRATDGCHDGCDEVASLAPSSVSTAVRRQGCAEFKRRPQSAPGARAPSSRVYVEKLV
eukprot:TRINITY_DN33772_c0_g1_i1.p1 TRINITY_DN33772_c0_g1~~TRINITY_DN33772_c0_g1_i1.p1  ORF type:complete len:363 (-),score=39.00 TRINITY_DN33772_c0_g1_i1:296-1384(-)